VWTKATPSAAIPARVVAMSSNTNAQKRYAIRKTPITHIVPVKTIVTFV